MSTLDDYLKGRDNNFNLLRLIAAIFVIYSHSKILSGHGADPLLFAEESYGILAVSIFFILSGFLVSKSALSRKSLLDFIVARVLRIFPALIVAVLFCAFVVGGVFTSWSYSDYYTDGGVYKFIEGNIRLLPMSVQYYLPGVFANNAYRGVVNGSLWTLPFEIWAYVSVAILLIAGLLKQRKVIAGILILLWVINSCNHAFHFLPHFLQVRGLSFFTFFYMGVSFYLFREKIPFSGAKVMGVMIFSVVLYKISVLFFYFFYPFILPYLTFGLGLLIKGKIRKYNQFGDYSYGTYIFAFPMQQAVATLVSDLSHGQMFVVSVALTLPMAFSSWHLVEKPCLEVKEKCIDKCRAMFTQLKSSS